MHVSTTWQQGRKARQTSQLHPGQLFFQRKEEELPWVGFEPTILCSLGECSLPTELPGQLCWQGFESTRQPSNHCAMAQYTLTQYAVNLLIWGRRKKQCIYAPFSTTVHILHYLLRPASKLSKECREAGDLVACVACSLIHTRISL